MSILVTLTASMGVGLQAQRASAEEPIRILAVESPAPVEASTAQLETTSPSEPPTSPPPPRIAPTTTSSVPSSPITFPVRPTPTSTVPATPPTTIEDPTLEEIDDRRAVVEIVKSLDEASGGVAPVSFGGHTVNVPTTIVAAVTREDCIREAKTSPLRVDGMFDRNLIAQMTHGVFECMTDVAGLGSAAPTAMRRWNGAAAWGFGSLSDQVAAEAVVVAYCESMGFDPRTITGSNAYGYAGLFQMGKTEMARFGERGSGRFDPVDNAIGAANYFVFQYRNRAGWGGWSPWAVVNTNFNDPVNDQVRVPVLPRFVSTDPQFAGRRGPELPVWAVDPWSWEVPHFDGTGCPFTGRGWPAARPLDG